MAVYRRTSLPFRVAFMLVARARSRRPKFFAGDAQDAYQSVQSGYTLVQQSLFGYHRVFELMRHLRCGTARSALKVLSIGPRTEIELYYLWLLFGFSWENITGADLVSLNPKIEPADMSKGLPFADNAFDVIVASHCLEKSRDPAVTRDEIIRVAKAGAQVCVAGDRLPDGASLVQEAPIPCRYFDVGVYGFIDFYGVAVRDIEYCDARAAEGFRPIVRVRK
jgi:SAM-dependent methyltransferase